MSRLIDHIDLYGYRSSTKNTWDCARIFAEGLEMSSKTPPNWAKDTTPDKIIPWLETLNYDPSRPQIPAEQVISKHGERLRKIIRAQRKYREESLKRLERAMTEGQVEDEKMKGSIRKCEQLKGEIKVAKEYEAALQDAISDAGVLLHLHGSMSRT